MRIGIFKKFGLFICLITLSCTTPEEEKKIVLDRIKSDNEMELSATLEKIKGLLAKLDQTYSGATHNQQHDIDCIMHQFNKRIHEEYTEDSLVKFEQLVMNANSPLSPLKVHDIAKYIANEKTFHSVSNPESAPFKSAKNIIVEILKYHGNYLGLATVKGVLDKED